MDFIIFFIGAWRMFRLLFALFETLMLDRVIGKRLFFMKCFKLFLCLRVPDFEKFLSLIILFVLENEI